MKKIGLYIHIPFCNGKCPYCDFYSVSTNKTSQNKYVDFVVNKINEICNNNKICFDTVYFGGGTPSVLGTDNLVKLLNAVYPNCENAEITIELNPESGLMLDLAKLKSSGANRLSVGLQSAVDSELALLGRNHSADMVKSLVKKAQNVGFDNISLDLMLGISEQTKSTLQYSIDFCKSLDVQHISAYMLKIEKNTPYYFNKNNLVFADEDKQADFYNFACEYLNSVGYNQYEISNFSQKGKESKHNLKYWRCEEYIGLGPGAHSFLDGKRYYYARSFDDFYKDIKISDGDGGSEEEYAMLKLRLAEGLKNNEYKNRFNKPIPDYYFENAKRLFPYVICDDESIRLTAQGFLLSNTVIFEIIF